MHRKFSSQRQLLYGTMESHGKNCCLNDPRKIRQILQNGHASPSLSARSPQLGNGHAQMQDSNHEHSHDHGDLYHVAHHESHHDAEHQQKADNHHSAHQIIGVAILEFGVVLHSFVVGMTLAVVERFPTLFVVITLHRMLNAPVGSILQLEADLFLHMSETFEGLGLGARLAGLKLPQKMSWVPLAAAVLFSAVTPVGLAVGLAVRKSYSPDSPTALIVSGILDSLSAGILLYTGLVELLCAEFLFHQEMREAPLGRVLYALGCVILGAVAMSILGKLRLELYHMRASKASELKADLSRSTLYHRHLGIKRVNFTTCCTTFFQFCTHASIYRHHCFATIVFTFDAHAGLKYLQVTIHTTYQL